MKHCLFEATICLCGVNNKIQKRVSDYKFIYANLRIRQNNLVVCNEFNFKLLKFFTSNIWFNCILHVMRNFHEKSKCGINFLLRKIPVVRAGFEPGSSRLLSQRSTITPLFRLNCRLHNFTAGNAGLRVLSLMQSVHSHWPISIVYNDAPPSVAKLILACKTRYIICTLSRPNNQSAEGTEVVRCCRPWLACAHCTG